MIFLKDPASKQPLPDFSGLRMRDIYAKHLGASLLAPPLPFEINLGPPRVVGEVKSLLWWPGQLDSRGVPLCLRFCFYASAALETALVGRGAKWTVLDMFLANRCLMRVGCSGDLLLYA